MKILHSWLRTYLPFKLSAEELTLRLTMLGLEFESVEHLGEKYRGFVVGKVMSCSPHPAADRLTVCEVNVGTRTLRVVCGAPNVAPGQKVIVGLPGATIPHNQHDPSGAPFVLAKARIRGVESEGMICSELELGLGKDAEGILVLDEDARVGQEITDYLGLDDVTYDVEITPNRPDWLSHIGVAREIGALVGKRVKFPRVRLRESGPGIESALSVTVQDRANCMRFAARMIRGVTIAPSPRWMQNALRNVGMRPRNNVVDITNYVMLECGHPLHAFDHGLLKGGAIVVRQAQPGAMFETLDGKRHTLPEGAVMVCDGEREVSIAGIMGGANSEINEATADVVLEAAYWNPSSIRRTAKAMGISTDASQRFERGADPNVISYALDRAASLVLELAGGRLLRGMIDVYPRKIRPRRLNLRVGRVNELLGTRLSSAQTAAVLRRLGLTVRAGKAGTLECTVPTFRVDLEREIDLIEEVARVYGYDNIEEKTTSSVNVARGGQLTSLADIVRRALVGAGFREAVTNSMHDEYRAGLGGGTPARLLNPLSQEMAIMRTSLLPGLLDVVVRNQSYGNTNLRIFEIGHVFKREPGSVEALVEDYVEENRVAFLITGDSSPVNWSRQATEADLFDLKGEVEALLAGMALDKWNFVSYSTSDGLTDDTLAVEIQGATAGHLGRLRSDVRDRFGIRRDVWVAELSLARLKAVGERKFSELPRFPRVRRDVAFFIGSEVPAGDVISVIRGACGDLVQTVDVFDLYEGEAAGAGRKSLAFSLDLMSRERTLTDAEIDAAVHRVVEEVGRRFGAVVRSSSQVSNA